MKVIELLNRIANNEEVPNKIRIKDREYLYDKYNNWYFFGKTSEDMFINKDRLNNEVEVIEKQEDNFTGLKMYKNGKQVCSIENETLETQTTRIKLDKDKKIEMLPILNENNIYNMVLVENQTRRKINEIIDKINEEN